MENNEKPVCENYYDFNYEVEPIAQLSTNYISRISLQIGDDFDCEFNNAMKQEFIDSYDENFVSVQPIVEEDENGLVIFLWEPDLAKIKKELVNNNEECLEVVKKYEMKFKKLHQLQLIINEKLAELSKIHNADFSC